MRAATRTRSWLELRRAVDADASQGGACSSAATLGLPGKAARGCQPIRFCDMATHQTAGASRPMFATGLDLDGAINDRPRNASGPGSCQVPLLKAAVKTARVRKRGDRTYARPRRGPLPRRRRKARTAVHPHARRSPGGPRGARPCAPGLAAIRLAASKELARAFGELPRPPQGSCSQGSRQLCRR